MPKQETYILKCPYRHKEWMFLTSIEKGDLGGLLHCPHCGSVPSIEVFKDKKNKF